MTPTHSKLFAEHLPSIKRRLRYCGGNRKETRSPILSTEKMRSVSITLTAETGTLFRILRDSRSITPWCAQSDEGEKSHKSLSTVVDQGSHPLDLWSSLTPPVFYLASVLMTWLGRGMPFVVLQNGKTGWIQPLDKSNFS